MTVDLLANIPSPPQGVWQLGPIPLRGYALSILAGIVIAVAIIIVVLTSAIVIIIRLFIVVSILYFNFIVLRCLGYFLIHNRCRLL